MQPLKLPELPYEFGALEPFISKEIMELHYSKHHAAYVNNFNLALEKLHDAENRGDLSQVLSLQSALKFNGGGHINHSIFWTNLAPHSTGFSHIESGPLHAQILKDFGSFDKFKETVNSMALALQGSGWVWLGWDKLCKKLILSSCPNQDPLALHGFVPLMGIDVWEHAYYLQYKNVRADYVKNIWNVINFRNVEERFIAASI